MTEPLAPEEIETLRRLGDDAISCVTAFELLARVPATLDAARWGSDEWTMRLVKAARDNHCGDAACLTRRTSAAVRVLTGAQAHQDYCWAVETFEVELGLRDPATVGPEPSVATLDAARSRRGYDSVAMDGTPYVSDPGVARSTSEGLRERIEALDAWDFGSTGGELYVRLDDVYAALDSEDEVQALNDAIDSASEDEG